MFKKTKERVINNTFKSTENVSKTKEESEGDFSLKEKLLLDRSNSYREDPNLTPPSDSSIFYSEANFYILLM